MMCAVSTGKTRSLFYQNTLMSKTFLNIRTFVSCFVALLQIFLLPATHMFHLGCQHGHVHSLVPAVVETIGDVKGSCRSSHSCNHGAGAESVACKNVDEQSSGEPGRSPVEMPHDEDSCPVCQAVFASQIASSGSVDLLFSRPTCGSLVACSPIPREFPRYVVLSRGPPRMPRG